MEFDQILRSVLRDFAVAALPSDVRLAVADPESPINMDFLPDAPDWFVDGESPILLQVGDNVSDVSADAPEDLKAAIASRPQDFVIDETGRPWPEVLVDGSLRVLDVMLDREGGAAWAYRDDVVCSVGSLQSLLVMTRARLSRSRGTATDPTR